MATLDLSSDFGIVSTTDTYVSRSPAWCVAVIRFKNTITFDSNAGASISTITPSDSIAEAGPPLIITSDCVSLEVHSGKGSHVSGLNAVLMPGTVNYLTEIIPGDWVFAWMLNHEDDLAGLVERLQNGNAANYFDDGLKFVGRAYGIRKTINQAPGGLRTVRYQLQANGFTELDSQVYWDPSFARAFNELDWIGQLNLGIQDFFNQNGQVDSNRAIPQLLKLLVGQGIPYRFSTLRSGTTQVPIVAGSTAGLQEGAYAYIIPTTAAKWLGKATDPSKPSQVFSYSDILEMLIGVQTYTNSSPNNNNPASILLPDGTQNSVGQRSTPTPLLGLFLPTLPQFANTNVWSLLHTYVNPSVNEMFITLKCNALNQVVPTLQIRQLPFTSDSFVESDFKVSRFLDLPRWNIPNQIIENVSIGRSDSTRFNFVHLVASPVTAQAAGFVQQSLILNPPVIDQTDVRRSGLRMSESSIACAASDVKGGPAKWISLKSDILMGMHLFLTGSLTCFGIQAPISAGDNITFDGAVFHIEDVAHSCSINGGVKSFQTNLTLSYGVRDRNSSDTQDTDPNAKFEATNNDDLTGNDPGFTVDGSF